MHRSRVAAFVALLATLPQLHPIAASQAVDAFRVATSPVADVQQETLLAVNPESRQTTEVFPRSYVSPYGEAVTNRIATLLERVDEATREKLVAMKLGVGFDRSILRWRARPDGRTVALAVRYFRDRLWQLELEMTDDYGRSDPVDPARYEYFAIAVCSRSGADVWTCREEPFADVASRHDVRLPQDRAGRMAAAEQLVEMVLAGK